MAEETLALRNIEQPLPQPAKPAGALVEGHAVTADAPLHARRPVVAQVLADAGQVVAHLDAELLQALPLADARELQQLRGRNGAGRDDHLAGRARLQLLSARGIAHTDAARTVENEALGQGVRLDAEIRAQARRLQIASRRAHTPALADRGLRHGDAFLVRA